MLVLYRGIESNNICNNYFFLCSAFLDPKLWNSSKSLKNASFFSYLDLLFLAPWSALLSFETWVSLRPILSLKDTASPIVRVPDIPMVLLILSVTWLSSWFFPQLNNNPGDSIVWLLVFSCGSPWLDLVVLPKIE